MLIGMEDLRRQRLQDMPRCRTAWLSDRMLDLPSPEAVLADRRRLGDDRRRRGRLRRIGHRSHVRGGRSRARRREALVLQHHSKPDAPLDQSKIYCRL